MAHRDVDLVRARLAAIGRHAERLALQAEDLHWVAYERPAGGEAGGASGKFKSVYLDTVGNQRARLVWRHLVDELAHFEITLVALAQAAGNLLSEGASPPKTRGSLIGAADFARAVHHQRRRRDAGEYTPHRTEDQPRYPGGRM